MRITQSDDFIQCSDSELTNGTCLCPLGATVPPMNTTDIPLTQPPPPAVTIEIPEGKKH